MNTDVVMTNEELVELIQNGVDVQRNLKALYEQNKKYIYKITIPFMKYAEADDIRHLVTCPPIDDRYTSFLKEKNIQLHLAIL